MARFRPFNHSWLLAFKYPLVMTNIAMEAMAHRNRWFTELQNGWIFHGYVKQSDGMIFFFVLFTCFCNFLICWGDATRWAGAAQPGSRYSPVGMCWILSGKSMGKSQQRQTPSKIDRMIEHWETHEHMNPDLNAPFHSNPAFFEKNTLFWLVVWNHGILWLSI